MWIIDELPFGQICKYGKTQTLGERRNGDASDRDGLVFWLSGKA